MNQVDFIMRYEAGELESAEEYIDGFAELIRTGLAWQLQGSYGRAAHSLIEQGYIKPNGEVTCYPTDE